MENRLPKTRRINTLKNKNKKMEFSPKLHKTFEDGKPTNEQAKLRITQMFEMYGFNVTKEFKDSILAIIEGENPADILNEKFVGIVNEETELHAGIRRGKLKEEIEKLAA